jgi:predicted nucleic acid-binding protein
MAGVSLICDTGPLVAFFNRADQHHPWAREQFNRIAQPLLTCEAVISEVVFLLQQDRLSSDPIFEALERGKVLIQFSAEEHWPDLRHLMCKYGDLPMSLADACLVRMAEVARHGQILTADRHFRIYRRHGRQIIPLVAPF